MARPGSTVYHFVSEPEERFICSICHQVMVQPVETPCGHIFCNDCLQGWLSRTPTCPVDRQTVSEYSAHTMHYLAREIGNLKVHCPKGCSEQPTLQRYQEHVESCEGGNRQHVSASNTSTRSSQAVYPALAETAGNRNNCHSRSPSLTKTAGNRDNCHSRSPSLTETAGNRDDCGSLYPVLAETAGNRNNCPSEDSSLLGNGGAHTNLEGITPVWSVRVQQLHTTCAGKMSWLLSNVGRRRCVLVVVVVVLLLTILAIVLGVTVGNGQSVTSALNSTCNTKGGQCRDPSGSLHLSCDLSTHTCLLQVGQDCSGSNHDYCVSGASCAETTKRCVCGNDFHEIQNICVLELGEECTGWRKDMCSMDEYCDVTGTRQCQCLQDFHPSGNICRLKAKVPNVNCSEVMQMTSCVENAFCDVSTEQCLCDQHFSVKREGTCGLQVSEKRENTPCADFPLCVDNATCSDTLHSCVCDENFAELSNHTCGLKAEVPGVDCSQVTACVENAACDPHSRQCLCDQHFLVRGDGTCGLKANVPDADCRQAYACVENATCDTETKMCLCDENFSVKREGTCGLQVSVKLENKVCTEFPLCVDNATCHNTLHSCVCDLNFAGLFNGTCGLKAQIPSVDCSDVDACVENATCDRSDTRQCLCDNHFSVRREGTCGLKANVPDADCRQAYACVENATCDTETKMCLCDENFSVKRAGTCGLQVSVTLGDRKCVEYPPCVDNATCHDYYHSCSCDLYFSPLKDRTCGLKAEVPYFDCRQVTACVEHATCNSNTQQCLCDNNFSVKQNQLCGLQASVKLAGKTCAEFPLCVDNAQCSDSLHSCQCQQDFAQLFNRTCGLKTDVPAKDCRHVSQCVQYAVCRRVPDGNECVCDSRKSVVKSDGTCGLIPNVPTDNCDTTICADSTSCRKDTDSGRNMCGCGGKKRWDGSRKLCAQVTVVPATAKGSNPTSRHQLLSGSQVTMPFLIVTIATSVMSIVFSGWL